MHAVSVALLMLTGVACSSHSRGPLERYEHRRLNASGEVHSYTVYVPRGYRRAHALPLVVVLHGCDESAADIAAASAYSRVADQRRFIVLYPGVSPADIANGLCWGAIWDPSGEGRNRGDAAAIARMTRAVIEQWRVDRSRVYAIGISAGAFETEVLGAAYPDLYAAIGIHSGAPYMGGQAGCLAEGGSPGDVRTLARAALIAMGRDAHLMPVIVIHGDRDPRIPYACGREAANQWLRTNDLILRHQHRAALDSAPSTVSHAVVPGGQAYTVASYVISPGCPVVQFWTIHGMGHYWSGGSGAPASARYSDPRGPSATAASWAFFSHWRHSGPVESCTHSRTS